LVVAPHWRRDPFVFLSRTQGPELNFIRIKATYVAPVVPREVLRQTA
jgi:hypothetical protein